MAMDNQAQLQPDPLSLPLTPREREVLRELAQGNSNKAIARTLSISAYTVDGYVKDIYRKLGVRNRPMAAMVAFQYGLLDMRAPAHAWIRNDIRP